MNPIELPAQRQLEAYNAKDLQAFIVNFHDDIEMILLPSGTVRLSGKQAVADFYASQRFNKPNLHAELLQRIVCGSKVVDHERIVGIGDEPIIMVVIWEVEDGVIRRAYTFEKP